MTETHGPAKEQREVSAMSEREHHGDRPRQEEPRGMGEPSTGELGRSEASPRESQEPRPQARRAEQPGPETEEEGRERLLLSDEASELRGRWESIQASFVDEPREAVVEADKIVGQVVQRIEERFESERGRLEAAWASGEDVSTEELRIALRRYADFFNRLLEL